MPVYMCSVLKVLDNMYIFWFLVLIIKDWKYYILKLLSHSKILHCQKHNLCYGLHYEKYYLTAIYILPSGNYY